MTPEQIAAIAGKLTKAQRERFLHPLLNEGWHYKYVTEATDICMPEDCIERVTTTPGYTKYRLSPLGLAVRAHLEKEPRP